MPVYLPIHKECDRVLSESLSEGRISDLTLSSIPKGQYKSNVFSTLKELGLIFEPSTGIYNLTDKGRQITETGGIKAEFERLNERERKEELALQLGIKTSESVIDTNESVKTTNQSVQALNTLVGNNIDTQNNIAKRAVLVAVFSTIISFFSLLKECKSDNKTLKLDQGSIQSILDSLQTRSNPDTILKVIHDTVYQTSTASKKISSGK